MELLVQQEQFPLVRHTVCPMTLLHQSEDQAALLTLSDDPQQFLGRHWSPDHGGDELDDFEGLAVQEGVVDVFAPHQELTLLSLLLSTRGL